MLEGDGGVYEAEKGARAVRREIADFESEKRFALGCDF
jgi:hypothetical protein